MSGGIEAAADIVTGGLIGRAIEPQAGEAHGGAYGGAGGGAAMCLNCGHALIGEHCHHCGQAAHVHRTIGAIGHDIAHGVFHFDGKMWRTLPMLAWRPGELTRRYVNGERARFVAPLAIFLFTVFLMFTIVANLPGFSFEDADLLKPGVAAKMMETRTALAEEQGRKQVVITKTQRALAKARAAPDPSAASILLLENRLAKATEDRNAAAATARMMRVPAGVDITETPSSQSGNWFEQKLQHAKENPKLLLYKVKMSAYKFSWALIPISLPFIWLLFPLRRGVGMYDHAVFATYSLTFMSLLSITLAVAGALGVATAVLWTIATIVVPLHMYRQLKGAYRLTRIGALWRTFWLLNFAFTSSIFFMLLLIYLGVAD